MARNDPQLNFRIPADLKATLEAEAKKNSRPLSSEIIARLQGQSSIENLKEQMEKSLFETNYQFARFGIQALLAAAHLVIDDASETLRDTRSFKFLQKVASASRIPPELPTHQPRVGQDASTAAQRVIDDLGKVADDLMHKPE